MSNLHIMRLAA